MVWVTEYRFLFSQAFNDTDGFRSELYRTTVAGEAPSLGALIGENAGGDPQTIARPRSPAANVDGQRPQDIGKIQFRAAASGRTRLAVRPSGTKHLAPESRRRVSALPA